MQMYFMYRREQNAYGNLQPKLVGVFFSKEAASEYMKKVAEKIVEEDKVPIREQRDERIVLADVGSVIELYTTSIYMDPTGAPWLLDE